MKNYTNNNYALNKHSKGIVYKFANEIVEVTLESYLYSNPDKTEADFLALKALSDSDHYETDRATYRQTWKDILYPEVDELLLDSDLSAEQAFLDGIDLIQETLEQRAKIELAYQVLNQLTEAQKRRYILHRIQGLTVREIAEIEGCKHPSVVESLAATEKKIKKLLKKS